MAEKPGFSQQQTPVRPDLSRGAELDLSRQSSAATAGGGLVRVTVDGHRSLRSLVIAPEAFESRDPDLLADLIMAAITEAQRRLDDNG